MVSGVCEVAPSTPKPPARLTAATTSRQWLKASSGNSIPSMSQIGDFMAVFTPLGSFGAAIVDFHLRYSVNASPSEAEMPSQVSGQVILRIPGFFAFHAAKYATR